MRRFDLVANLPFCCAKPADFCSALRTAALRQGHGQQPQKVQGGLLMRGPVKALCGITKVGKQWFVDYVFGGQV